eukprot:111878_1
MMNIMTVLAIVCFIILQCNCDENIRFCSIGMGVFGTALAKVAIQKGFKMVSAFTRHSKHSKSIGEILQMTEDPSLSFLVSNMNDLESIIDETKPHFCIDATNSTLQSVFAHFIRLLNKQIHIITLADEAVYPDTILDNDSRQLYESLDTIARQNNVSIVGGGYSDSILIPVIPSLAASMQTVTKIQFSQTENIDEWGDFAHHAAEYGVGLTQKQFENKFENEIDSGIESWQKRVVESIADGINKDMLHISIKRECYIVNNKDGLYSKVISKIIPFGNCAGMNTTIVGKTFDIDIVFSVIFAVFPNMNEINDIECKLFGSSYLEFVIPNVDGKVTTAASLIHRVPFVLNKLKPGFHNVGRLEANRYWKTANDWNKFLYGGK